MPSIKKRSENTYLITVSDGYDREGRKIAGYKTVHVDPSLTSKQKEKEVARIAALFEVEFKQGKHIDPSVTYADFAHRWLSDHCEVNLERKTSASYKAMLDSIILPAIGHIRLAKLKPPHLIGFYNNMKDDGIRADGKPGGYSTRTIKYCHQIISSSLSSAVQWQVLSENVAKRVKPPKGNPPKPKAFFDDKQAMRFLEYIDTAPLKFKALMHVAIYGGLRLEEALPLVWEDLDFEKCSVRIDKALSYVDGEQFVKTTAKNDGSIRTITLPRHIFSMFEELRPMEGERIFLMHYTTPYHWLQKKIKKYNDTYEEKLPLISFHGLRHTNITLSIAAGVDIRTVSGRAGHKSVITTQSIYSHFLKSRDSEASDTLEEFLKPK